MEKTLTKPRAAIAIPLVALISALPALRLYSDNAYVISLADVLLPMGVSVALGLLLLLAAWLIVRDLAFAALLAACGMALFLNFNLVVLLVDWLMPQGVRVRVYYIAGAAIGVLLLAALLWLRRKPGRCALVALCLLIFCGSLTAMCAVTAIPGIVARYDTESFTASESRPQSDAELPNIYYLIADEYASFTEIQKYYGYDNSAFSDALTDMGFSVSDTSYNRGGGTMRNMADTVNLQPVTTDEMALSEYVQRFNTGALYGILEEMGYSLSQLGGFYPLPELLKQNTMAFGGGAVTMNGETAAEILMKNSMLMPIPTMLYWRRVKDEGSLAVFNYLDDPENYTAGHNRAIFLYICSPHPPFYYDADGNAVDTQNWTNWTDPRYYLDQYIYITRRLTQTAQNIIANDPGAIILLQSDHGLRYHEDSDKPHTFWIEEEDQRRILNALYFGGKPVDITGLSGYNTWRAILSELGEDYPILPEERP